jgi:hypothetical protein
MARFSRQISKIAATTWRCCVGIVVLLAVAPAPGVSHSARAAPDGGDRLISATFFSDACRQKAASLGILSTTDAQFLIEAFAQSIDADPPDVRAQKRAGSPRAQLQDADCEVPAVALINLLRLNSVAAEPVLVRIRPADPSDPARFDNFSGLAVYVSSLARYVDPAARDGRAGAAFDRAVRARAAQRMHIIGPAPYADPATDRCGGICIVAYGGQPYVSDPFLPDAVRVKTETIHVP